MGDQSQNKHYFDTLFAKKASIERAFGGELEWERLDDKRACRVRFTIRNGGLTDGEANWPAVQASMVDAMARIAKALKPELAVLDA